MVADRVAVKWLKCLSFNREVAILSPAFGAVAQLGERCVRNAEVEGSTPFRSTRCKPLTLVVSGLFLLSSSTLTAFRGASMRIRSLAADLSGDDHNLHDSSAVGASGGASGRSR